MVRGAQPGAAPNAGRASQSQPDVLGPAWVRFALGHTVMMWSKLRVQVRANLCEELKDRIDFHVAMYRKSHDSDYGRAWISFDGHQIGSWSCFEQLFHRINMEELRNRFPRGWTLFEYDRFVAEQGVYSKKEFKRLLAEYLNLDPRTALSSAVPLTRILAVSDRRIGRRTLARFPVDNEVEPIVKLLWYVRTQESQQGAAPNAAPPHR